MGRAYLRLLGEARLPAPGPALGGIALALRLRKCPRPPRGGRASSRFPKSIARVLDPGKGANSSFRFSFCGLACSDSFTNALGSQDERPQCEKDRVAL